MMTAQERLDDLKARGAASTNGMSDHTEPDERAHTDLPTPIDWGEFWKRDPGVQDYLVEPLIPRGRQIALYAPPKSSKSLLTLEMAAAVATGRPVLERPASLPVSVIYFDMEMTQDDLHERLTDFDYGPDDDLSHLHYYSLPLLPPLDTWAGGETVMQLVELHRAEFVVMDTFGRVVVGKENDSDTIRAYYRNTGSRLKAAEVTTVRIDHAGKDAARGQRGSSSKDEDVDIIWKLAASGDDITLTSISRLPWIAERVSLKRQNEPLTHRLIPSGGWPVGTAETAALLDRCGVPLDATAAQAVDILKAAGHGKRKQLVLAALKHRKARP